MSDKWYIDYDQSSIKVHHESINFNLFLIELVILFAGILFAFSYSVALYEFSTRVYYLNLGTIQCFGLNSDFFMTSSP
jgi:hypothetical protein